MGEFDLLIEGATVLTMDAGKTVVNDGVIGVVDGTIALIGKRTP